MGLPIMKKCCGCLALERGCTILAFIATAACILDIVAGAWYLPHHRSRYPEDNLISMSMVMFATLSVISNVILLAGIYLRRPGYVKISLLFNLLFMTFMFLIAVVTCLFSPEFKKYVEDSVFKVTLIILALIFGAVFCFYYLIVVNSVYRKMKSDDSDSVIPV